MLEHKNSSFNCLTDEQFKLLCEQYEEGDEFNIKGLCQECESYYLGDKRCSCGNRRIYIVCEKTSSGEVYFYADAY